MAWCMSSADTNTGGEQLVPALTTRAHDIEPEGFPSGQKKPTQDKKERSDQRMMVGAGEKGYSTTDNWLHELLSPLVLRQRICSSIGRR